jgi:hypothetical protein
MRTLIAIRAAVVAFSLIVVGLATAAYANVGSIRLKCGQGWVRYWRLRWQRRHEFSRPDLSTRHWRGELRFYLWQLVDRFRRDRHREGEMRSLLLSIIERARACATQKKEKPVQWHSRKEANAEWRSIMAKYRSPLSEAPGLNINSPKDERPHDPRVVNVGVPPALASGFAQRLAAVRVSSDLTADRRRLAG